MDQYTVIARFFLELENDKGSIYQKFVIEDEEPIEICGYLREHTVQDEVFFRVVTPEMEIYTFPINQLRYCKTVPPEYTAAIPDEARETLQETIGADEENSEAASADGETAEH